MTPIQHTDISHWQQFELTYSSDRTNIVWHQVPGTSWRTSEGLLQERRFNHSILMSVLYPISDEMALYMGLPAIFQYMTNVPFDQMSTCRDDARHSTIVRGDMNRQGMITEAGVAAFENNGEIQGSLAVSTSIRDSLVKLDLRIVGDNGETLVEWEGVDVIDGSQVTWCFSDTGNIRITMDPIVAQNIDEASS